MRMLGARVGTASPAGERTQRKPRIEQASAGSEHVASNAVTLQQSRRSEPTGVATVHANLQRAIPHESRVCG